MVHIQRNYCSIMVLFGIFCLVILCLFLQAPVLDFGKIIIYTSNLKIIRAPQRKRESGRSPHRSQDRKESSAGLESRSKGRHRTARSHAEEPDVMTEQKVSTVWSLVDCKYSWLNDDISNHSTHWEEVFHYFISTWGQNIPCDGNMLLYRSYFDCPTESE